MATIREILGENTQKFEQQFYEQGLNKDSVKTAMIDLAKSMQRHKKQKEEYGDMLDDGIVPSIQRGVLTTINRTKSMYNGVFDGTKFDLSTTAEDEANTKELELLEQVKQTVSRKDLSPHRLAELNELDTQSQNADTNWENIKAGANTMIDVVSHPTEWTTQGVVEMITDPLNLVSFGAGSLAGKLGRGLLSKGVIGGGAGVTEGVVVNSGAEYIIAKGQNKNDEEANKIAWQSAGGGAMAGGGFGTFGGIVSKTSNPIKLEKSETSDILDNELLNMNGMKPLTPDEVGAKLREAMGNYPKVDAEFKTETAGVNQYSVHPENKGKPNFQIVYDNLPVVRATMEKLPVVYRELVEVEILTPEQVLQLEAKHKKMITHKDVIYANYDGWSESVGQDIIDAINQKKIFDMKQAQDISSQAVEQSKVISQELISQGVDGVTIKDEVNKQLTPSKEELQLTKTINDGMPVENRFAGTRLRDIAKNTIEAGVDNPQDMATTLKKGGVSDELANVVMDSVINKDINKFDDFVVEKTTQGIETETKLLKKTIVDDLVIAGKDLEQWLKDNPIVKSNDPQTAYAKAVDEYQGVLDNGEKNQKVSLSNAIKKEFGKDARNTYNEIKKMGIEKAVTKKTDAERLIYHNVNDWLNKNQDKFTDNTYASRLQKAKAKMDKAEAKLSRGKVLDDINKKDNKNANSTDKKTSGKNVSNGAKNSNSATDTKAGDNARLGNDERVSSNNGRDAITSSDNVEVSAKNKQVERQRASKDIDRVVSKFDKNKVVSSKNKTLKTIKQKLDTLEKKDIQDFGDKIGGARKDFGKRSMEVSDLINMNEMEASKLVVKKNLWKPLDYKALKEDGYSSQSASYIKRIKDAISTSPVGTKEAQANYVSFVNDIKEVIFNSNKDVESIANAVQKYIDGKYKQLDDNGKPYGGMRTWNDLAKLHSKQGVIDNKFLKKINLQIYTGGYFKERYGKYGGVDADWSKMIKEAGGKKTTTDKLKVPKKEYLSSIERDGRDWRKGKDIDEKILQDTFNFRAGEFGNWVNQKERQASLNSAFDGLMDLAEVLKIDPKAIGLNGKLAIAFGSRGKSSAMAHYEPARVVINLTKVKGAGSLAHEWLHSLDNYIGKMGKEEQTIKGKYASDISTMGNRYDRATMKKYLPSEGIDIDLVEAFKDLNNVISKKVLSVKDKVLKRKNRIETLKKDIAKWENWLQKAKDSQGYAQANRKNIPYWKRYIPTAKENIIDIEKTILDIEDGTNTDIETGTTSFMQNAKQLDGKKKKPYWSSTIELTARAFESYIFDTAKRSDYLVAGVQDGKYADPMYQGDPYPAGSERVAINKVFDELMDVVRGDSLKGFEKVDMTKFDDVVSMLSKGC